MMKTSQRILVTATRLFNEQGERNVTATDIALELDISPGNLYYHFKGKDAILTALFQQCYRALAGILATPILESSFLADEDPLERCWLFLTVLLEAMYDMRFLYFNQSDLMQRYPDIDRGMRRLMSLKRQAAGQLASALLAPVNIGAQPQRLHHVSDSMALTLMYWLHFEQLSASTLSPQQTIHRAVLQILSHCAPYLGDKEADFYRECELIDSRLLDTHSA
jgi:AcrR family transcriptional regulator